MQCAQFSSWNIGNAWYTAAAMTVIMPVIIITTITINAPLLLTDPLSSHFFCPEPKRTALFSLHLWTNFSISNSLLLQLLFTCVTGLKVLQVLRTCEGTQHFYFPSSCWIEFLHVHSLAPTRHSLWVAWFLDICVCLCLSIHFFIKV